MDPAYSKAELLNWLSAELDIHIARIEQCGNGVVYLKIMDKLYPGKVPFHKVKLQASQEWENLHNLKLLQMVFLDCNIQKRLNLERVAKCLYIDNLEVLQWMKRFYDRQTGATSDLKLGRLESQGHSPRSTTSSSKLTNTLSTTPSKHLKSVQRTPSQGLGREAVCTPAVAHLRQIIEKHEQTIRAQTKQINDLKQEIIQIDEEREFFFKKLRLLELMTEEEDRKTMTVVEVQAILFDEPATEENQNVPTDRKVETASA